jgi:putative membrane protein
MGTSDTRHPRPQAIILSGDDVSAKPRNAAMVLAEPEPVDAIEHPAMDAVAGRSGFGWGKLFVAGLGGFFSLAMWLWVEKTLRDLLVQSPLLATVAIGLLAMAGLALVVMLARVLRDLFRARKIEGLRKSVAEVQMSNDLAAAKAVAADVMGLTAKRPETARGRASLEAALPGLMAAGDVLALTEREVLAPLDAEAAAMVAKAAKQVSLVTAISPRAIVDVLFVVFACARLLRGIAGVYGARPGTLGLIKLGRSTLVHLMVTGGMAAGDTLLQQIMGQGLAARLSAKLGEGLLNGLLTARIGLAAIAQCRPMPFVEERPPGLKDVAGELMGGTDVKGG